MSRVVPYPNEFVFPLSKNGERVTKFSSENSEKRSLAMHTTGSCQLNVAKKWNGYRVFFFVWKDTVSLTF